MFEENTFNEKAPSRLIVHDSPYFKIINFNFKAGQELPIHSHDIEGEVSIAVLEGKGEFLGDKGATFPARPGDILISKIAEPHGLRAKTDMRVLVTIAPPI
jgi:quercetin dioxygenase-like cupin family protein